jgi:hypothetical protein
LTKGKIRPKITTPNYTKLQEKTDFVTYSCYLTIIRLFQVKVKICSVSHSLTSSPKAEGKAIKWMSTLPARDPASGFVILLIAS